MAHNPTLLFGNMVTGAHFPPPDYRPGFDPEFAYYDYSPFAPGPDATNPPVVIGTNTDQDPTFGTGGGLGGAGVCSRRAELKSWSKAVTTMTGSSLT